MPKTQAVEKPNTVYLKDYLPPDYRVETIELYFDLGDEATVVTSRLSLRADYDVAAGVRPLVLDGQELELISIGLNGEALAEDTYSVGPESLTLHRPPENFFLEIVTRIHPQKNTALEGLYTSGGVFCTQCESQGFRKITYYPDRPDVMAVFTTTVVADKKRYPVLLSNGNLTASGDEEGGRHFATWQDPFPKPCYLFALVAGDLACVEDSYTTASGREVALRLYVREHDLDKCGHALNSLKKAMAWDERIYGREYDLDIYMIVAVSDFNMGAMENKGLNVFNTCYVLARPDTATDSDYVNIESVIGHEYFHNWSGNRVTCRDWFQLSLKEGFTVFRDEQFTADMTSQAVKRIGDVSVLRSHQFTEDAGPMAHPVRPASYVEINNFYTATVYNKGAEVVRMIHILLGAEGFRKGTDLYFERHDGQAVTTDDFIKAMEDANGIDLSRFKRWYEQAGTPALDVSRNYDGTNKTYTLTLKQSCPPTPGQPEKKPFHIPLAMGLLDREGHDLPLQLQGEVAAVGGSRVLEFTEPEQSFTFINVPAEPVPSLLRGFSAPVKLNIDLDDTELAFLMGHDSDPFNRWDAGQQLAVKMMLRLIDDRNNEQPPVLDEGLSRVFAGTLTDKALEPALIAQALSLPAEAYVAEFQAVVDPLAIHEVRMFLRAQLATAHRDALLHAYEKNRDSGPYSLDAAAMGRRSLRNLCLAYLLELGEAEIVERCMAQFKMAHNMTDVMAALTAMVHSDNPEREAALEEFYRRWKEEPLVLDKWFAIQASSPLPDTLSRVKELTGHPDFSLKNPNRMRSLIGVFCMRNPARFHDATGEGYVFLSDHVLALNDLNPQVAARMLTPLTQWRRYDEQRQALMQAQLERILAAPSLSKDVYEIASKSLGK